MRTSKSLFLIASLAGASFCYGASGEQATPPAASPTPAPLPDTYRVKFETSKGDFVIEVTKAWAPLGAERFHRLVSQQFFDGQRFFRVLPKFVVQFGISGNPSLAAFWRTHAIQDDKVKKSNGRGMVTYAMAGPNSRTTQIFINLGDNSRLDKSGFAPFGKVVKGLDVVESFFSEYGEGPPNGTGPDQRMIQAQGNAYLDSKFPKLDYIKTARFVEADAK